MKLGPYLLGPNDTPENGIYTGDARELAKAIPDESVDLIFTDPVYQNIDDYRWLAKTAARVLKQDRACLAWGATALLPQYLKVMIPSLSWACMLYWQRYGHMAPGRAGLTVITQCLWFEKGYSKTYVKMADWCGTTNKGPKARQHDWGKPEDLVLKWSNAFTLPDFVVADFFGGSGVLPYACNVLGRRYLAFEIDPATAELARERVRNTQPPLFVPQPEQQELQLD